MRILVYGAGSLGSLIGGLLTATHEVVLLGRDPHMSAIEERGLSITGHVEETVYPETTVDLDSAGAPDLAIVTVNAYDTESAAQDLRGCDPAIALSLQNGMGNEERLADTLEADVLAGTTTYGAYHDDPGVVDCTGVGSLTIGPYGATSQSVATRIGAAFDAAGIETDVVPDPRTLLWEKLAVNAGINPVTALARVPNGALVGGPAEPVMTRAAVETARVARAAGVDLPDDRARESVRAIAETTAENRSSMLTDVTGGTRTEIDAINGYVVERAEEPVPINETLTALIRAWEAEQDLR